MQTRGLFGLLLILMATASWALAGDGPSNGLVATTSPHGVAETADRAEAAIAERGLGIFARIDQEAVVAPASEHSSRVAATSDSGLQVRLLTRS